MHKYFILGNMCNKINFKDLMLSDLNESYVQSLILKYNITKSLTL